MKTYRVVPTLKALNDADRAYDWIAEQAPDAALDWLEGLFAAFQSLSKSPRRCPISLVSGESGEEIRQLNYGRYRVLFTIGGDSVFVVAVKHSAREVDPPDEISGRFEN
jgi:plasmid stabilization system protein ParE